MYKYRTPVATVLLGIYTISLSVKGEVAAETLACGCAVNSPVIYGCTQATETLTFELSTYHVYRIQ
jgi:hypothetical protein